MLNRKQSELGKRRLLNMQKLKNLFLEVRLQWRLTLSFWALWYFLLTFEQKTIHLIQFFQALYQKNTGRPLKLYSWKKVLHFENETRCWLECWESVIHFNYCQSKSYSFPWGFITLRNTLLRAPCGFDKWHEESSIGNNFLSLATRIQSIVILNTHILHIILLELIQYWMRYRHRTRTNNIDILGSRVQGPVTGVRQMSHSYWLLHGSIIRQSCGLDRVIISPTLRLSKDTGQSCVHRVVTSVCRATEQWEWSEWASGSKLYQ